MTPATEPPQRRDQVRMLVLDSLHHAVRHERVSALPALLSPGDVLVVNDAATMPASLAARTSAGAPLELRLVSIVDDRWTAVTLGPGDWRTATERRAAPPQLAVGDALAVGLCGSDPLRAQIVTISGADRRVVTLDVSGDSSQQWQAIYRCGRPIQYSYVERDLDLWSVQTAFAGPPVAAEMPSAGRPLTWRILLGLRKQGIQIASLTHSAGLSSVDGGEFDASLPLAESYTIPVRTATLVNEARQRGARVVAVGTTVVRALESAYDAAAGCVSAGTGRTDLIIDDSTTLEVVDALLTGIHDPASSHYRLLRPFATLPHLQRAWRDAERRAYRYHEFGDVALIGRGLAARAVGRPKPARALRQQNQQSRHEHKGRERRRDHHQPERLIWEQPGRRADGERVCR